MREIYAAVPVDWRLFIEHKLFEPAFYSTVINDWGTSYFCARELGDKASCLVDLGHHAPNVNIEQIVSRLIQFQKLGGFHFNDSKYGDDDLDAGSVKPFQLFLIFNELVDAELNGLPGFDPSYMLDQSHNVTDPIESLVTSAVEVSRAYVQAHLVDRARLVEAQQYGRRDRGACRAKRSVYDRCFADTCYWRGSAAAARSILSRFIARAATAHIKPKSAPHRSAFRPGSFSSATS